MKLVHNIKLSVFSYEDDGEDTDRIAEALAGLVPFDLEQEKLSIKRTNAWGFDERKIVILELTLTKERHTNRFLQHLKGSLSEGNINLLRSQLESRLDEGLNFFIRLDRQKLFKENKCCLTDSGDCFHIRMSMAAYPKDREKALEVVNNWLG